MPLRRAQYLAAGNYEWSSGIGGQGQTTAYRRIHLASGWYTWKCTIHAPVTGLYQHTCSLDHGAGPAYLVSDQFRLISGQYTMQSFLTGPY